MDLSKEKVSQ